MPLEFLSAAQVAGYGRFGGVPSQADLERFFVLDDTDRGRIGDRRGDHNRLGFVLQATTVRYVGRFLEDPLDVPWPVVEYLPSQLGIVDASCVKRYPDRAKTAYEHAWEIRDAYGFRVFEDEAVSIEFCRFLDGRAWTLEEGPAALFQAGVGWLRRHLVLLPGVTVLTRLVNTVRDAAADRMHALLAAAATITDPIVGAGRAAGAGGGLLRGPGQPDGGAGPPRPGQQRDDAARVGRAATHGDATGDGPASRRGRDR